MIIKFKSGKVYNIPSYYNFKLEQNGSVFEIDYESYDNDADCRYVSYHLTIDIDKIVSIEVNNGRY